MKKVQKQSRPSFKQKQRLLESQYRTIEKNIMCYEVKLAQLRRRQYELELEIANYESNSL